MQSRSHTTDQRQPFAVNNRLVLAIAIPMTLAYLTTPLLGLVDTAVIGQFGDAALLGGLAAGAIVFDVVFTTFNFLRSGTTGLVAQAFGRDDRREEQAVFWRAAAIALVSGLLLALLAPLFAVGGAMFIDPEPRVAEAMDTYVRIRMLAAPLTLLNYAILGYVLGRGEGALGLLLQLVLNGANIVLSVSLGLWLGWGIEGVAWGTAGGELAGVVVGLALLARRFRREGRVERTEIADMSAIGRMFSINRDIMIRSFVLLAAFAVLARQGAQFGTLTLAVNAVLMNFFLFAGYFLDGLATAAEQLAGRAIGARYRPAFDRAVRLTALWGFGFAFALAGLFLLFGDGIVALVTTAPSVREGAATYLPWAAFTAVTGVLAFQMDGVFIGATWSRDMRNMMLHSFCAYLIAVYLLGGAFGNHGLWAALHIFLVARGVSLYLVMGRRASETFAGSR